MRTYRDLIYIIFDELKIISDDSVWEPDHIMFLLNKYRAQLLKQRYAGLKKDVPLATYQQLLVDLQVNPVNNISTSLKAIPNILNLNGIELESSVSPVIQDEVDNSTYNFNLITIDRFKYITVNKWLKNCVYVAFDYNRHLVLKGGDNVPSKVIITAILEDPREIINFLEESQIPKNIIDLEFPIEEALIPTLTELVIKEIGLANYLPGDQLNNAKDDLEGLNTK